MTTLVHLTPYVAFVLGVAMMMRALHLYSANRPNSPHDYRVLHGRRWNGVSGAEWMVG